jgi:hypothetical protein
VGVGFRGGTRSTGAVRTMTLNQLLVLKTLLQPVATIQLSTMGRSPTPVRLGILLRTGMGCTTWRGMCWGGAGIGTEHIRVARRATRVGLHRTRAAWSAVAVGSAAPGTAGARSAMKRTTTSHRAVAPTGGSGLSCPRLSSESNNRSGACQRGAWSRRLCPCCAPAQVGQI